MARKYSPLGEMPSRAARRFAERKTDFGSEMMIFNGKSPFLQFFANYSPQSLLERLPGASNVLLQRTIDARLIAAATGRVDFGPEPLQHLVVEPDGDPSLAGWQRPNRATAGLREIIFLAHHRSR
jgi:hypothetical protein